MKYWYVWYDGAMYKLANDNKDLSNEIARFGNFDMAYQYVTQLNGTSMKSAYSRWTR